MGASQQPSAAQSEQDLSEALDVDPDEYEWVKEQLESAGIQLQHARLADDDDGDGDGGGDDGDDDEPHAGWTDPSEGGALAELLGALEEDGDDADKDEEQALLARVDALIARLAPDKKHLSLPGPDGDTALHLASLYGRRRVVARLLEAGADPTVDNPEDGTRALHDAAAGGYDEIVDLLLEREQRVAAGDGGAKSGTSSSLAAQDEDGDTPLHCAARGGHLSTVLRLLEAGADPAVVNEKGATPRDEADDDAVRAALLEAAGDAAAAGAAGGA